MEYTERAGFYFFMKINILTKNIKLTSALKNFIEEKINPLEKFVKVLYSEPGRRISTRFSKRKPRIAKRVEISLLGEKYYGHFFGKGKPMVEAWMEVGKETLHHKKGPFFWAECQMRFPGKSIRSTARAENLELAVNEVKDELQRELKEYKEKIMAKEKRGARIFREGI